MFRLSLVSIAILTTAILLCLANATEAQEGPAAERDRLADVLASDAPYMEKLAACSRLAVIGDASSVAPLAPLLVDEKLSHAARIGLEAIPDAAAAEAFRDALPKVKGQLLMGVIHSIGARRDEEAVPALGDFLDDPDPQILSAAARALGRIDTNEAARSLEKALPTAPKAARFALGGALLMCAEAAAARGETPRAAELYSLLRADDLPPRIQLAATRGAILLGGTEGIGLLAGQLDSPEDTPFAAAVATSREISSEAVTKLLTDRLPSLTPGRQVLVLRALGARGDGAACPAVLEVAESPHRQVRLAAIDALATLGDASTVSVLVKAAADSDPDLATAALSALAALTDPKVDRVVADMISAGDVATQRIAVELAGRRQIVSAVPALIKAIDSPDETIRLATIVSLGNTIGPEQLPLLTERLLKPVSDKQRAAVKEALSVACLRAVDKTRCAETLVACLPKVPKDTRCFLLELLGTVGTQAALDAVSQAALEEDETIEDAATRVLGEWLTPDAAPALLRIAREATHEKYRIRALRGAIRILRQMDIPDPQRLVMCREAMQLAQRDEERALVVEALGRIPSAEALAEVVPCLQTKALKTSACRAIVAIGETIVSRNPSEVREASRKALTATADAELVRRAKALVAQTEPQ